MSSELPDFDSERTTNHGLFRLLEGKSEAIIWERLNTKTPRMFWGKFKDTDSYFVAHFTTQDRWVELFEKVSEAATLFQRYKDDLGKIQQSKSEER